jgi:hypothetical protein
MSYSVIHEKDGDKRMARILTMDEARARPSEELLREVADTREPVRIDLRVGNAVEVRPVTLPALELEPLETLPGYVPDGWKDAIYEPRR